MTGKVSAEVKEAMRLVDLGARISAAALDSKIARSTLIRALKRRALALSEANKAELGGDQI